MGVSTAQSVSVRLLGYNADTDLAVRDNRIRFLGYKADVDLALVTTEYTISSLHFLGYEVDLDLALTGHHFLCKSGQQPGEYTVHQIRHTEVEYFDERDEGIQRVQILDWSFGTVILDEWPGPRPQHMVVSTVHRKVKM